ncbi:MAG: heat-inducible transcriptional repressor HrcA [bacterium]
MAGGTNFPELGDRKRLILSAIVQSYIRDGEPVGSRTIAKRYDMELSAATIRNEMADLEEMGYLMQPHTSAGRIPTDQGYRVYVNELMKVNQLSQEEMDAIRAEYSAYQKEVDKILEGTSTIISQISHYIGVVLAPKLDKSVLRHIELIFLEPGKMIVMIVTSAGVVKERFVEIDESITEDDLHRISRMLNDRLKGLAFSEITQSIYASVKEEEREYGEMLKRALRAVSDVLASGSEDKVYFDGTTNVLGMPEFSDPEKVRMLFDVLKHRKICEVLAKNLSEMGVKITIGSENEVEGMDGCSLVSVPYTVGDKIIGSLGLIGPTRMAYPKAVSIVNYTASVVSEILTKLL